MDSGKALILGKKNVHGPNYPGFYWNFHQNQVTVLIDNPTRHRGLVFVNELLLVFFSYKHPILRLPTGHQT